MSWSCLENGERNIAAALMTVLLFLPGCNEFGWNPLDPNYKPPVESAKEEAIAEAVKPSQLSYSLSVFEGGSSIYDEYIDIENGQVERRRDWSGNTDYPARGGLVTVQATGQNQVTPLQDPSDAVSYWPHFTHKKLVFETLYRSENALGDVFWRRFTRAGSVCVMFSQTLIGAANVPRRLLAGYYCAPAGIGLSEGQAETVVQSVRVWDSQS